MKKTILDLIFPITCLGCSSQGRFLCPSCLDKIPPNQELPQNKLIVALDYKNPFVKEIIHQYKYNFIKDLSEPLAELMSRKLSSYFSSGSIVLIPVPLHKKRLRWRGFNQSDLLAQEINQRLNFPIANDILIRKKHTLPQVKIENAPKRKQNIKNAFQLNSDQSLEDKTIILIDDISTTGATLKECAKALKPLKPKEIWGLVLAKG